MPDICTSEIRQELSSTRCEPSGFEHEGDEPEGSHRALHCGANRRVVIHY
jgi:hypothetical protein